MDYRTTITKFACALAIWIAFTLPAAAQTLYVDGSSTIQQAMADAHRFPAAQWVTIFVAPGDYNGPVIVDRPRTRLIAQSVPVLHNAKLTGHNPAVFVHPPGDPAVGTLGVTANNVEVRGFDVDGGGAIGISALGFPHDQPGADDLLLQISGVQISGNVITNAFAAIQIVQASAVVSGNASVDDGGVGFVDSGGPVSLGGTNATVTNNVFSNKFRGALLIGALDSKFEFPRADGPAGSLVAIVTGNDFSGNGIGVTLDLRGAFPLSGEPGKLIAVIEGNRFGNSETGVSIQSQQCYFNDVCSAGAPGSSVDALLINNDLKETTTTARFSFNLDIFGEDTGVFLQGSKISVRAVRTPLGEFAYDNSGGGNTLIVNGVSYTGSR